MNYTTINDPIAWSSTTNKYYGFLNIYGYTGTINDLYITQGTEWSVLDWTTWSIYTGNITIQNKITNPVNNSGIYLLDRSNINKQRVISWTWSVPPITYSYWSEIIKQKQPMKYSGSSIIYYGISWSDRDTSKFIWANKEPSNWSLAINEVSPTTEENITVTFTATNNMNWYLFGDITTNLNWIILANQSITTWAILSWDSWYKNVFIQLQTWDTELTHYVDTIQYEADSIAPTVSTWYISVGTTGINWSDLYYKGTISIKSDISDNIAINSWTCEYSLTWGRYAASGTNTYCEVTNITPNQDINIQFRVQDMVGNIGTWPLQNYLYDNTPPTGWDFLINNWDEYTSGTNLNLNITCATDTGINWTQIAYGTGVDPDNWTTCTTPVNVTVDSTNETKIVYIRFKDSFDNITSNIVQSIILDTTNPIIGFTGSTPTDNTITSDVSFTGEVEITEENIWSFTRNRNETEYILWSNILNLFYTSPNNNDIISTIIDQNNRMSLNITWLVLGMNFDNNLFLGDTWSTVGDFSIYNNDGIVHWATWNSGKFWWSYQFDGIDDYIGIVNNSWLSFWTNDLSISFWFLVNNKSDQTLIFGSSDSYYIQILSETLRAYFDYSNTNTRLQTSEYETWKWNHTTIVYDRDNKMSLFVNWDLKWETDISWYENNNITNSNILLWWRWYRYLSWSIDEIRIYNKALSTGEILQLYNSNLSKTDTNKRQFTSLQTGLTEWFYTYLSTVTDNVGNTASTETRTITIDQTGPEVIFTGSTPADNSTISGNHFSGFAEITETNLSSFTRNRDWTNYPIYDSWLVLMMNFDNIAALGETTWWIIKDLSIYGNDGTGYNNPSWTSNGKFGGAYEFNWTTQYISTQTKILWSSATFIAWGKTNNISTGMLWNHPVDISVTYFDLLFSYNTIYLNRGNWYTNPFNSWWINVSQPTTWERHNYATIIDYTENKAFLYIDWKYVWEAMYRNPTSTNTGRIFSIAWANSYRWSWYIDDFYIYNRALSSWEILQLYKSNLSKYDTDKRQFTTEQSCLIDRTYNYSITTTDNLNNETTTGRSLTIQLPNPTVGTPTYGLNLPEITNWLEDQTIEQSFTGEDNNFWVYDTKGYTWWYTTIQLSWGLLNPDWTHEIAQENIQFKADPTITTIEWQISTAVALATGMDEYKTMTGIYNYIIKNYTPECSSCIIGKYGNTPSLKVTIPAFQKADTYNGTIIFTLYN